MSTKHREGFAGKHGSSAALDEVLAEALRKEIKESRIGCGAAHRVAKALGRTPSEIGKAIDLMEVRLVRCQLGLFGYHPDHRIVKPATEWNPAVENDIRAALEDRRLPCTAAWSIARRHGLSRLAIANICEALEVKVRPCQLGAF